MHQCHTIIKKSRKAHKCSCCYNEIEKGTSYHKFVSMDTNDFLVDKIHPVCIEFYYKLNNYHRFNRFENFPFDDFIEMMHEFINQNIEHPVFTRIKNNTELYAFGDNWHKSYQTVEYVSNAFDFIAL